nr:histidine phosphatase family protein [Ferrimicrobium acidiphilum]
MRHGQTEWNQLGRFNSSTDLPLNAEGREDVRKVATHMTKLVIERVVSSPSIRSIDSAKMVCESLNSGLEIEVWEELREVDFGDFEGYSKDELQTDAVAWAALKDWFSPYRTGPTPPNSETWEEATARAKTVIGMLSDGGGATLVVSHGYFLRLIIVQALELTPPQAMRRFHFDNSNVSALSNADGYWRLLFHNTRYFPNNSGIV